MDLCHHEDIELLDFQYDTEKKPDFSDVNSNYFKIIQNKGFHVFVRPQDYISEDIIESIKFINDFYNDDGNPNKDKFKIFFDAWVQASRENDFVDVEPNNINKKNIYYYDISYYVKENLAFGCIMFGVKCLCKCSICGYKCGCYKNVPLYESWKDKHFRKIIQLIVKRQITLWRFHNGIMLYDLLYKYIKKYNYKDPEVNRFIPRHSIKYKCPCGQIYTTCFSPICNLKNKDKDLFGAYSMKVICSDCSMCDPYCSLCYKNDLF